MPNERPVEQPVGRLVPERANWCKLTECLGKPRCAHCTAMDHRYGPGASQSMWFYEQGNARQEVYRHKKTGGIYGVICNANRESDGELLVVYRNLTTGDRWVRPAAEFNDGRFELVQ